MPIQALRLTALAAALGLAAGLAAPAAFAEGGQQKHMQQQAAAPMIQDEGDNRGTRALNLLMAKGYTQYSDFQKQGTNYTAQVTKNGETMQVVINPDAGTITEKQS